MNRLSDLWSIYAIRVIIVIAVLVMILIIISIIRSLKTERRISNFALTTKADNQISLFDSIVNFIWTIIHSFANLLNKSKFLKKYSQKYDKYNSQNIKSLSDYLAIKILLAITLSLLTIITYLFQFKSFPIIGLLIALLVGYLLPDLVLNFKYNQNKKRIEEDLLKAVIIMNNAFKANKNILQAIEVVSSELEGPITNEFSRVLNDIKHGLTIEIAFNRFYQRTKISDIKYIASTLSLLNKTGGDIKKVFNSIEENLTNRKKMRNELKSMTAAGVFVFRMLVFLPIIFIVVILILNPDYFTPLYTTGIGIVISILTITIYVLYIFTIKKTLRIDLR